MATLIFDSYDTFLSRLGNDAIRAHLEKLPPEAAAQDQAFQELQNLTRRFEEGLERFFFDSEKLRRLTRTYGVF